MDLIRTDKNRIDVGIVEGADLDLAFGLSENNFAMSVALANDVMTYNEWFYIANQDKPSCYGGVVDDVKIDTYNNVVTYSGRTLQGVLAQKVVQPNQGEDYLIVSGNVKNVLESLITRHYLSALVVVDDGVNKNINSYQFDRYTDLYKGINKMLKANGMKLNIYFFNKMIHISAVDLVDYSQDEEWDSSQLSFVIEKAQNYVNHLICLGKGELKEREVIHLYRAKNGQIGSTQEYFNDEEICEVYDNSSTEELEADSRKHFEEVIQKVMSVDMNFKNNQSYDIGDVVGMRESLTNTFITRSIVKCILKLQNNTISLTYEIG